MFDNFYGNPAALASLEQMLASGRIPQTILLDGPTGVGKATLARRFAARLLGESRRIEMDDLSLPAHQETIAERLKLPSDKRASEPYYLCSHPDFVTFPPDGPLRQISIHQMRVLREQAQFAPLEAPRRVFLIDGIDRANEDAANSLLKTLEEPPPYLIIFLAAENAYDLLPTIRSRSISLRLRPLDEPSMIQFAAARQLDHLERRVALAAGCPGAAATLDLAAYDQRREAMLALLLSASARAPFGAWARYAEKIAAARSEKLDTYLDVLYVLLEDLVHIHGGHGPVRNPDIRPQLESIASAVPFPWLREAVRSTDALSAALRRNIQKSIALDGFVTELLALAR